MTQQRPANIDQFVSLLIAEFKMSQDLAEHTARYVWDNYVPLQRLKNNPYLFGLSDGIVVAHLILDAMEQEVRGTSHLPQ
jgi:hypothetical protein